MRRPTLPLAFVAVFCAGAMAGYGLRRPSEVPPPDAYELAERLYRRGERLRVLPLEPDYPHPGVFLTQRGDKTLAELAAMPQSPKGDWAGTVLVEPVPERWTESRDPKMARRVDGLLLFGDPELVRLAADALR